MYTDVRTSPETERARTLAPTPRSGPAVGSRPPSPEETVAWAKTLRDLKDRSMVLFLMDTRLRVDEIALLDMDAIEFTACKRPDGSIETIGRGSVPVPNTVRHREFFLSARTVEALSLWGSRRHESDKQVAFTTKAGVRRLLKLVSMMIREWCYRLIVERLRLNELRHSVERRLFDEGGGLRSVARVLGYVDKYPAHEVPPPLAPHSN